MSKTWIFHQMLFSELSLLTAARERGNNRNKRRNWTEWRQPSERLLWESRRSFDWRRSCFYLSFYDRDSEIFCYEVNWTRSSYRMRECNEWIALTKRYDIAEQQRLQSAWMISTAKRSPLIRNHFTKCCNYELSIQQCSNSQAIKIHFGSRHCIWFWKIVPNIIYTWNLCIM